MGGLATLIVAMSESFANQHAHTSVTMAFYRKLAALVEKHGDRAYQAVAEAIAQSVGKRSPTRYFAKAVVLKFRELGWWEQKQVW